MKKNAEVIIIGGGINGCTLAYELSKEKVDTVLLEKGCLADGASGRCGAIIWSIWNDSPNRILAEVGMRTVELFAEIEEELGTDIEYTHEDSLTLVSPGEERYYSQSMRNMKEYAGVSPEYLKPEEIKKMAPYIGVDSFPAVGGYHLYNHPANASANPFLTVEALAAGAKRLGAKIYTGTEVTGIDVVEGKIEGVRTTEGSIQSHTVINAAGGWSSDVARLAGIKIPAIPYRDQALVTEPLEPLPYFPDCSETWSRQTKNGEIIAGMETMPPMEPDYETESGYSLVADLDFLARIVGFLRRLLPKLNQVNVVRHWGGFADVTPDDLPILGEVDEVEGLILACGCSGYGFCFSQVLGKLITDLIVKEDEAKVMELFNLRRFEKKYREYPGRWYGYGGEKVTG